MIMVEKAASAVGRPVWESCHLPMCDLGQVPLSLRASVSTFVTTGW